MWTKRDTLKAGMRVGYSRGKQYGYGTIVNVKGRLEFQPDNDPNSYGPLKNSRTYLATAPVGTSNGRTVPGFKILTQAPEGYVDINGVGTYEPTTLTALLATMGIR